MAKLTQKFIRVFVASDLKVHSLAPVTTDTTVGVSTSKPLYIHLNEMVYNKDGSVATNEDGTLVLKDTPLAVARQSQSYMLDLIHDIEARELGLSYIPVKNRPESMSVAECIKHNSAYQQHVIQTVVSFDFGREDLASPESAGYIEDALNVNGVCIQRMLPNGEIEETLIKRFLRTSSHSRAGGAWFSSRVEDYTRIFTYGQETPETPIFSAPAKWDSRKALVTTTSLPISLGDDVQVGICVVDDITRLISTKVVSIAKGENESPLSHLDGFSVKYKLNGKTGVEEFEYEVSEPFSKVVDSTLTDGTAICTTELMSKIATALGANGKEEEYLHAIQLRAPWMKGMLAEFDILGWCKAHNITHMRDVYGKFHAIEDIQMIVPKSVFKCWNLYMTNGISSLYDIINGEFTLNDNTYKYFKDGSFLRAASVNKAKKEYNPMTYQYLQALINLEPQALNGKADVLFNLVEEAMEDISKAKAVLGMSQSSEDYDYDTITSKASHLLEMCPESFDTRFIKSQIIKTVRTMLEKQAKGRVMEEGSYHFLLPDLTTFFAKEVYREEVAGSGEYIALGVDQESVEYGYTEVSMEECHNYTVGATERCGILDKGFSYMTGEDKLAVAFRSPLVHMAEPQKLNFNVGAKREELDRWFGQLKGCCIFNSYELIALAMGGASL